jgi:hypothetical protein
VSQAMNGASAAAGHERCGGRTRAGTPCKLPPGHGTDHPGVGRCDHHGGATPTHRAHAERVLVERAETDALAQLHRIGVEPVGNPLELLAELAAEAREWQKILRGQVAELESLTRITAAGTEQIRSVVLLFERALDRAGEFAAMMSRLNIDDRLFKLNNRIAVAQGERLFVAVNGILEDLGHDPRDPAVRAIAGARFEQLVGAIDDG